MSRPFLSQTLQIVLTAVTRDGLALRWAHSTQRADREIALTAVTQHARAHMFVADALRGDRELVMAALKAPRGSTSEVVHIIQWCSEELKQDKEIIFEAAKINPRALMHAHRSVQKDQPFVQTVVEYHKFDQLYDRQCASLDNNSDKHGSKKE